MIISENGIVFSSHNFELRSELPTLFTMIPGEVHSILRMQESSSSRVNFVRFKILDYRGSRSIPL